MTESLPEGWTFPTATARKMHYHRGPDRRSLCGKYDAWPWAELQPDDGLSKFDCLACRRKLDASKG